MRRLGITPRRDLTTALTPLDGSPIPIAEELGSSSAVTIVCPHRPGQRDVDEGTALGAVEHLAWAHDDDAVELQALDQLVAEDGTRPPRVPARGRPPSAPRSRARRRSAPASARAR
jgi:hypothetical protein